MSVQKYTLVRTGDRPVTFEAELIAVGSSHGGDGPAQLRWHEIGLYRVADAAGSLVLSIAYRTEWSGESSHYTVYPCEDAQDATGWLRSYDPCAYLIGPPSGGPGSPQEQRQARLQRDLRLRYENLVSEVLGHLEPELLAG